ncbi:hypothetical protein CEE45_06150 [Candidatus Heimdallarchaeota archaeon B3_Heim]|nr:MAG: hypothetical protein CEE45_06150 [Candidatus Heimdallarchaeota archaeon B3_Heim]
MNEKGYELERVFKPRTNFLYKQFLYIISVFVAVTVSIYGFAGLITFFSSMDVDPEADQFTRWITTNSAALTTWYLVICGIIMIVVAIIAIYYVRGIEYYIGDREVVVKKGIINKMEKHVPFRTITNISSRYGLYDRIFGIGTVQIETAGKSGTKMGPEEKIEGIDNYFEVRDQILEVLRQFRHQYATTTEVPGEYETSISEKPFEQQLLNELQEIKEILRK